MVFMKQKAKTFALIALLLLFSVAVTQFLENVSAQTYDLPSTLPPSPKVTITSLINQTVYAENKLPLTITVDAPWMPEYRASVTSILYQLDYIGPLPVNAEIGQETTYSTTLQDLREGNRNITVSVRIAGEYRPPDTLPWSVELFSAECSSTVYFTVDTVLPTISVISPENKTYDATTLSLDFTVSEPFPWAGYSLDGQENITINGNITLATLSESPHNLRVYANDTAGNMGSSEIAYFNISKTEPPAQPEPFPITLVIAAVATATVIGVGLLAYFKKRKH